MRRRLGVIIWVVLVSLRSTAIQANKTIPAESLDDAIIDHVNNFTRQPRTGAIYNVSLGSIPSLGGVEVSVLKLRSSTFWSRGVDFGYFHVPPRIIARPYVKRLAILFEQLQSQYYQVPGYQLVAPVLGISVYDASTSNNSFIGSQKLNLSTMGNPISFRFPSSVQINHTDYGSIRCISLGKSFEITNMTSPNVCSSREQGRFSLGVPTSRNNHRKEGNEGFWGWWVVRIASVSVVLVILGFLLLSIHRLMARKRIKEMEKRSDQGVPLDTFYIGRSKMPSASMIRTHPMTVENEYIS